MPRLYLCLFIFCDRPVSGVKFSLQCPASSTALLDGASAETSGRTFPNCQLSSKPKGRIPCYVRCCARFLSSRCFCWPGFSRLLRPSPATLNSTILLPSGLQTLESRTTYVFPSRGQTSFVREGLCPRSVTD